MTESKDKVLLVDDESEHNEMLGMALSSEGYEVSIARNGTEALHLLKDDQQIRTIILDIKMPIMNGIEVARKLRSMEKIHHKIMFLTAASLEEESLPELQQLAEDIMFKPYDLQDIINRIHRLTHLECQ